VCDFVVAETGARFAGVDIANGYSRCAQHAAPEAARRGAMALEIALTGTRVPPSSIARSGL
jgi:hypothetical protein